MTMRAIGDVLPAPQQAEVSNHQARLEASTGGRSLVVPPRMRGGEVVLVALPPRLADLSPELARRVRIENAPVPALSEGEDPPPRVAPAMVPRHLAPEIDVAIARLEEMLGQIAHERTIEAWVRRAVAGVANPPEGEDGAMRLAAVVSALTGEPDLCFTSESVQAAQRAWRWWPSAADAATHATEVARPYRSRLEALRRLRQRIRDQVPARPAEPEVKTPEMIAAVQAAARARMAESVAAAAAASAAEAERRAAVKPPVVRDPRAEALLRAERFEASAAAASESARGGLLAAAAALRKFHGLPPAGSGS